MAMKSAESVKLILADVLGSILKGVVCRCILLGLNIGRFLFLIIYYKAYCNLLYSLHSNIA